MIDLGIKIHLDEGHVVYDVVEPGSGYLVERFDVLMDAIRWAAIPMCQTVHYGYPHPGCAEFAPPDEIPCGEKANRRVEFTDKWTSYGEDPTSTVYLCDRCADEFLQDTNQVMDLVSDGPLPIREGVVSS